MLIYLMISGRSSSTPSSVQSKGDVPDCRLFYRFKSLTRPVRTEFDQLFRKELTGSLCHSAGHANGVLTSRYGRSRTPARHFSADGIGYTTPSMDHFLSTARHASQQDRDTFRS